MRRTVTDGNPAASAARESSVEPLSATMTSTPAGAAATTDGRKRRRWSAPFQLSMIILATGMSSFVLPAAMRPHPQFGTLADHPLQLTNVTLRDFVFGDLLFAVINQFEGHFVASPPQAAHLHEVDREVAAQGQFLATVEEDRILIEEAEPTAVGPPRGDSGRR